MASVADGQVDIPVKNTFIHFDMKPVSGGGRALRKASTDPSDPLPKLFDKGACASSLVPPLTPCALPAHDVYSPVSTAASTPQQSPRCYTDQATTASLPSDYTQSPPGSPDKLTDRTRSEPISPVAVGALRLQDCIPPTPVPLPQFGNAVDGCDVVFGLKLRLAEGVGLGVNVERAPKNQGLIIKGIREQGGITSWNRMVAASPQRMKIVVPGDRIVCVNEKTDCEGMLEEVQSRLLVKLTISRSAADHQRASTWWEGAFGPLPCQQWNTYGCGSDPFKQYQLPSFGIGGETPPATLTRI